MATLTYHTTGAAIGDIVSVLLVPIDFGAMYQEKMQLSSMTKQ